MAGVQLEHVVREYTMGRTTIRAVDDISFTIPEGEYSERVLAVAKDMGYRTILWSFAYKDWDINMQQGADYAFNQVTPYLHDGAILLLHAVSSDNANALEDIINYAKNEGYTFKSLDELQ